MMHRFFSFTALILLLISFVPVSSSADEGMWPLYDLDRLPWDSLTAMGLQIQPNEIYDPNGPDISDACISLSGGTAAFVSSEGLIVTNHHVAFGALQRSSTAEVNYVQDGLYAEQRDQEIPAIGYSAYVVLSAEDLTDRVQGALDEDLSPMERHDAIDSLTKVIVAEAEEGRDVRADLSSMYGGTQYILYTYLQLEDVRIVYAPPASIGVYGGEIDNWMWPRHTGDFSFLRAYTAPDGSPADYSEENVPYKPESWLTVSKQGVVEGDFAFMIGFPGRTSRYSTADQVAYMVDYSYPEYLHRMGKALDIYEKYSASDPELKVRLASSIAGIENYYKKMNGTLEGLERFDVVQRKRAIEEELKAFLMSSEELKEEYGWILPTIDSLYQVRREKSELGFALMAAGSVDYLALASRVYKWVEQRQLPDAERDRGYQDRDSSKFFHRLDQAQINLVPVVDKEFFRFFVEEAMALPNDQRLGPVDNIFADISEDEFDAYLDQVTDSMYANTKIGDLESRMAMTALAPDQLDALEDPFIELAAALKPISDEREDKRDEISGAESAIEPLYFRAILAWQGSDLYPDANSTRRFNYGQVLPYSPADAVYYDYITSLDGVIEKATGEDPFIVPEELWDVWEHEDYGEYVDAYLNDVPVNFITNNDGTNGSSGSPVMNGKGELIGLDFDTNYESVFKDYYYVGDISRAIVLDTRYMLFILDKVYHVDGLLEELTIK